jgi:Tol biopolymer transport system component
MMRHLALVLLIGTVACMTPPPTYARGLRIHPFLTTKISWFSLAVSNFAAATPELEETAAEMTRSIRDLLAHSGPYPFKQSDDLNANSVGIDAPPQFALWTPYGVGLLLVGRVSKAADGRLKVEIRLWDTLGERQITGRVYLASVDSKDRLALTIAGDIFEQLDDNYRSFLSQIERR